MYIRAGRSVKIVTSNGVLPLPHVTFPHLGANVLYASLQTRSMVCTPHAAAPGVPAEAVTRCRFVEVNGGPLALPARIGAVRPMVFDLFSVGASAAVLSIPMRYEGKSPFGAHLWVPDAPAVLGLDPDSHLLVDWGALDLRTGAPAILLVLRSAAHGDFDVLPTQNGGIHVVREWSRAVLDDCPVEGEWVGKTRALVGGPNGIGTLPPPRRTRVVRARGPAAPGP